MGAKRSKNQFRREQAKKRKLEQAQNAQDTPSEPPADPTPAKSTEPTKPAETTPDKPAAKRQKLEEPEVDTSSELFHQFEQVFERFKPQEAPAEPTALVKAEEPVSELEPELEPEEDKLTRREAKQRTKVPLLQLKLLTKFPELVEWYDADAPDPELCVALKTRPNAVQVPGQWRSRRDYLAKKQLDRPPFKLPAYIAETGIMDMREDPSEQSLKQQQRAKVQVRLGKLDIDYRKLHDAFFKFQYQQKPRLYKFGDCYYEGRDDAKEMDELAGLRPGVVLKQLRAALGMLETDTKAPPPWIAVMQRVGKPPAYASLMIPGVDGSYNNEGYHVERQRRTRAGGYGEKWGVLLMDSSLEEEEEEEEDKGKDKREPKVEPKVEPKREPARVEEKPRVERVAVELFGTVALLEKPVTEESSDKKLFTVVDEHAGSLRELLEKQFSGEPKEEKGQKEKEKETSKEKEQPKEAKADEIDSFKF